MKTFRFTRSTSRSTLRPRNRRGAAAVEMAVVSPILFLIILGIIEFGRAFFVAQLLTNAARDGARRAACDGSSNSAVTQSVESFLAETVGVSASDITTTISVDNAQATDEVAKAAEGDSCTVKIEIPFNKVQYIAGAFLSGKTLSAEITMRHE